MLNPEFIKIKNKNHKAYEHNAKLNYCVDEMMSQITSLIMHAVCQPTNSSNQPFT